MRVHDTPVDTLDGPTSDLTAEGCDREIDILTQHVVSCTCTEDRAAIDRWRRRKAALEDA